MNEKTCVLGTDKPSVKEFCALRELAGFRPYSEADCEQALAGSLKVFTVRVGGECVGMARVLGDGRTAFFLKDVVVDPALRGYGLGRALVEAALAYIAGAGCEGAYVGLMATPGTEAFYERFGFIRRPAPGLGSGMVLFMEGGAKRG